MNKMSAPSQAPPPAGPAIFPKTSRLTYFGNEAHLLTAVSCRGDLTQDNTVHMADKNTDEHA